MALKSMTIGVDLHKALASILDRASATQFSVPLTCLMSPVNWVMKSVVLVYTC